MRALYFAVICALLSAGTARAENYISPLRLGLMFGEPIAATVALDLSDRFTLHGDLGPSTSRAQTFVGAADLVYGMPEIFGYKFRFWFGAGLRYSSGRDEQPNRFGLRVPAGISYLGHDLSTEVFIFAAPSVSVVPDAKAALDGGLGLRVAL